MSEQHQAELLARWLADGGRGDPPEGLDAEALEAVYALRPDLAPPPRVSLDDILSGVTTGPFAQAGAPGGEAEVVPLFPATPAQDDPGDITSSHGPRGWRVFMGGAAGLLAAAAAVLLIVPNTALNDAAPAAKPAMSPAADERAAIPEAEVAEADAPPDEGYNPFARTRRSAAEAPKKEVVAQQEAPPAPPATGGRKGDLAKDLSLDDAVAWDDAPARTSRKAAYEEQQAPTQTAMPLEEAYQTAIPEPVDKTDGVAMDDLVDAQYRTRNQNTASYASNDAEDADARQAGEIADEALGGALVPRADAPAPASPAGLTASDRAESKKEAEAPPTVAAQIDRLTPLATTDPLAAADALAPWVRGSRSEGVLAATTAARWYEQAGRTDKALAVIEAALALPGPRSNLEGALTATRDRLLNTRQGKP